MPRRIFITAFVVSVMLKNLLYFLFYLFIFLGPGGGYNKFAGRDISRALAKMSFNPEDLEDANVEDLNEKQLKVLEDWIKTYEVKKCYPIVGRLGKGRRT